MVSIQLEKFIDVIEELKPLLVDHWEEIAVYKDEIKLDPDYDKYKHLEELGIVKMIIVRDDGVVVGYHIIMVTPHMHYQNDLFAVCDIVFLKPEYRNAGNGLALFKYTEDLCKEMGVAVLVINTKCHMPFDPLMVGMGYDYIERIYSKSLKD